MTARLLGLVAWGFKRGWKHRIAVSILAIWYVLCITGAPAFVSHELTGSTFYGDEVQRHAKKGVAAAAKAALYAGKEVIDVPVTAPGDFSGTQWGAVALALGMLMLGLRKGAAGAARAGAWLRALPRTPLFVAGYLMIVFAGGVGIHYLESADEAEDEVAQEAPAEPETEDKPALTPEQAKAIKIGEAMLEAMGE